MGKYSYLKINVQQHENENIFNTNTSRERLSRHETICGCIGAKLVPPTSASRNFPFPFFFLTFIIAVSLRHGEVLFVLFWRQCRAFYTWPPERLSLAHPACFLPASDIPVFSFRLYWFTHKAFTDYLSCIAHCPRINRRHTLPFTMAFSFSIHFNYLKQVLFVTTL